MRKLLLILALLPSSYAFSQEASSIFYGGGIGLAFGDVDYIEISPMIGKQFSPQLSAGVSLMYRWREDNRYTPKYKTEDYGGTIFARLHVTQTVYLQGEYEYLDYERYNFWEQRTEREQVSSYLAGIGISQPIGERSYAYASALYNFSYDEFNSPYNDPWVFRFGVSIGF